MEEPLGCDTLFKVADVIRDDGALAVADTQGSQVD
jgi:hypothetical protein